MSPENRWYEIPGDTLKKFVNDQQFRKFYVKNYESVDQAVIEKADVVFIAAHGTGIEDGQLQQIIESYNKPYVGSGVQASANCFDKSITKQIVEQVGITIAPYEIMIEIDDSREKYEQLVAAFDIPFFVKPAQQGSSVGVHRVTDYKTFCLALDDAFKYDTKILIEQGIVGREIEVGILGNGDSIQASCSGEVRTASAFYSYDEKYSNESDAQIQIPAKLTADQEQLVRDLALKTYQALDCRDLARVDFFFTHDGRFILNEVNTLPGFTSQSMYPLLWQNMGMTYTELITRLIELAYE